ncbi:uncharacterized protein LOC113474963 [Ciona intestinalis]
MRFTDIAEKPLTPMETQNTSDSSSVVTNKEGPFTNPLPYHEGRMESWGNLRDQSSDFDFDDLVKERSKWRTLRRTRKETPRHYMSDSSDTSPSPERLQYNDQVRRCSDFMTQNAPKQNRKASLTRSEIQRRMKTNRPITSSDRDEISRYHDDVVEVVTLYSSSDNEWVPSQRVKSKHKPNTSMLRMLDPSGGTNIHSLNKPSKAAINSAKLCPKTLQQKNWKLEKHAGAN